MDARKETREERALRREDDGPDRSKADKRPSRNRDSRDNRDEDQGRRFGDRSRDGARKSHFGDRSRDGARKSHPSAPRMAGKSSRPSNGPVKDDKPKGPAYTPPTRALEEGERIAKIMARAGLCSRRDAEVWITSGRVSVNGKVLESPAINIQPSDKVLVDGAPLPVRERTRLWLFHKPRGLVTTTSDPEGRATIFEKLPEGLPRVISVGRLDINTEGLLLLTNDGGLARVLELPATGWLRRYRVRAYGHVTQSQLDSLADGIALDGVLYGSIDAQLERSVGDNAWITVALREGKNREVKKVLGHLGLEVNRLIRVSYGPFQLLDLDEGKVQEVRGRVLREQLGSRLIEEAGADFDAPILTELAKEEPTKDKKNERKSSGGAKGGYLSAKEGARVMSDQKNRKEERKRRFEDDDRGDRNERGRGDRDRGDDRQKESYNAIPYAERKPFNPAAPRRTDFVFREDGADGKKIIGRSVRKVGGKPHKADLLDPNARIEKSRSGGKSYGGKGKAGDRPQGKRPFGEGRPGGSRSSNERGSAGRFEGNRSSNERGSAGRFEGNRSDRGRPSGRPGGPRGRSDRD